jgi:broad specificity phosphatase PhoE
MRQFCEQPEIGRITSIYSSNETKAGETAAILAGKLGLPIRIVEPLHENDRSATGFLPPPDFQKMADRFFAEPNSNVAGWERAVDAQARIVDAVRHIAESDQEVGDIAVVSHGGVGALLRGHLLAEPISRRHEQPGTGGGNYFLIELPRFSYLEGWHDIVVQDSF